MLLDRCYYDGIAHCVFPTIISNGFFSFTKNNFSTTLIPPKKQNIHIEEFFVDSIYSKTIDIVIKNIDFLFLNREHMCRAGHLDNCAILQIAF